MVFPMFQTTNQIVISLLFQTSQRQVACLEPWLAACPPKQPCSAVPGPQRSQEDVANGDRKVTVANGEFSKNQTLDHSEISVTAKEDWAPCDIAYVSYFRCCPDDQQKVLAVLVPLKLRLKQ